MSNIFYLLFALIALLLNSAHADDDNIFSKIVDKVVSKWNDLSAELKKNSYVKYGKFDDIFGKDKINFMQPSTTEAPTYIQPVQHMSAIQQARDHVTSAQQPAVYTYVQMQPIYGQYPPVQQHPYGHLPQMQPIHGQYAQIQQEPVGQLAYMLQDHAGHVSIVALPPGGQLTYLQPIVTQNTEKPEPSETKPNWLKKFSGISKLFN